MGILLSILFITNLMPSMVHARWAPDRSVDTTTADKVDDEKVARVSNKCSKFLKDFQKEAAGLMSESAKNFDTNARQLTGDPKGCVKASCSKLQTSHLEDAKTFQDRYMQHLLETSIEPYERGFRLPAAVKTASGTSIHIGAFSKEMKRKAIERLNKKQAGYIKKWLQEKTPPRHKKNWKNCVEMSSSGQLALSLIHKRKYYFKPKFKDVKTIADPKQRKECHGVQQFVHQAKNSRYVFNKFKEERAKSWGKFRGRQKKPMPNWLTYADQRIGAHKDKSKQLRIVSSTYNKMGKTLKTYVNGTGWWGYVGQGSQFGFKKDGAKSDRQLWKMANSMDYFRPLLHKSCPSTPWWGGTEGAIALAKEVVPGASQLNTASDNYDNKILTLANLKSFKESQADRRAIYNESARNGVMDIVPGGKIAGKAIMLVGGGVYKAAKKMAPKTTDWAKKAMFRKGTRLAVRTAHGITEGGEALLNRMDKHLGGKAGYKKVRSGVSKSLDNATTTVAGLTAGEVSDQVAGLSDDVADDLMSVSARKTASELSDITANKVDIVARSVADRSRSTRKRVVKGIRKILSRHGKDPYVKIAAADKDKHFFQILYSADRSVKSGATVAGGVTSDTIGKLYIRYKKCQRETNDSRYCSKKIRADF